MVEQPPQPALARPIFLQSSGDHLFAIFYPPAAETDRRHVVIHIPAFAEEMNKSRRMVTLQALELARNGYGVLVPDLLGTGDSGGEFAEASWESWKQNLADAYSWARHHDAKHISLWGLRMGALLAADFAAGASTGFENLILWHPVANGEQLVMQFLRLRAAAAMLNENVEGESTSELRKKLRDGQCVEVAGYELSPQLVNPLMAMRLNKVEIWPFKQISVFEIVTQERKDLSPANQKLVSALKNTGAATSSYTLTGAPFWSTQEIAVVPQLVRQTTSTLNSAGAA